MRTDARATVLVVEDKSALRAVVARVLGERHEVLQAGDLTEARQLLSTRSVALVVTDVRLPDGDGRELLDVVRASQPEAEVILMTAYASVGAAVDAVKAGAFDYLAKPFEPDDLALAVDRALERRALRARADAAEAALRRLAGTGDLLGTSPAMQQVRYLVERVCDLDVTVLLTGESGTGKEVVARTIHRAGVRRSEPFVAVNCGAIPAQLLESELFGHARGAFTGADSSRTGLAEEAANGTLFLDEIGDLPTDLQVKLNRALQERAFRRVGESRERTLSARIVAATHHDLAARVAVGEFREDLYFRLAVYPIDLPPLRARGDDVLLLAHHFLARAAERFARPVTGFAPGALRALADHPWPGNVRELMHAVDRAVILSTSDVVQGADLPSPSGQLAPSSTGATLAEMPYKEAVDWARERAVRQYLHALLQRHHGNVTQAARHAQLERESLHRLLRKSGLDAAAYRPSATD